MTDVELVRPTTVVHYRKATRADVPAMAASRRADPAANAADPRMAAYFDGAHHPQQALVERAGFVALDGDEVVGYIAGHRTTRFGLEGELQYLYVVPAHRRRGIATELVRRLAEWFRDEQIGGVCVNVDVEIEAAAPFYRRLGARERNRHWYVWEDVTDLLATTVTG